jgi:hypothetical protein
MLATWHSGWYNGLAKKALSGPPKVEKEAEHEVIVYLQGQSEPVDHRGDFRCIQGDAQT